MSDLKRLAQANVLTPIEPDADDLLAIFDAYEQALEALKEMGDYSARIDLGEEPEAKELARAVRRQIVADLRAEEWGGAAIAAALGVDDHVVEYDLLALWQTGGENLRLRHERIAPDELAILKEQVKGLAELTVDGRRLSAVEITNHITKQQESELPADEYRRTLYRVSAILYGYRKERPDLSPQGRNIMQKIGELLTADAAITDEQIQQRLASTGLGEASPHTIRAVRRRHKKQGE